MAYADQKMSGSKITAIIIVAIIHAVIGYAFVTGLGYQYIKKVSEKLKTFDVEEPPPPPDEPPPPPPEIEIAPPPVVTPPPIVQTSAPVVNVVRTVAVPPPVYIPTPIVAPPAPPPPPVVSKAASAKGDESRFFGTDSYPPAAERAGEQGRVTITWTINTAGRVENCRVVSSSGSSTLDQATCSNMTRRGRYTPATDAAGNPTTSTRTRSVRWVIEDR